MKQSGELDRAQTIFTQKLQCGRQMSVPSGDPGGPFNSRNVKLWVEFQAPRISHRFYLPQHYINLIILILLALTQLLHYQKLVAERNYQKNLKIREQT